MKNLAINSLGVLAVLVLVVIGIQDSMLLTGAAIVVAVGTMLLILLGPEKLGIAAVLLATFLAPINGLKLAGTGNVTYADFAYVAGFALLVPRLLQSTSRMPRLYTWGVMILVVDALVVSFLSADPVQSLLGFARVSWAIIIIPIVLHRMRVGRNLLNALAWAYVLGQIVSTGRGIVEFGISSALGGGRGIGWTTHPNFFALGGQLAFALCAFLFYRTPRQHRWIVVVAAAISALSVYQSGSRASLLCIAVIVVVWPLVERTAISTYVLVSFVGLVAASMSFLLENAPEGSALARLQGGGTASGSNLEREYLLRTGWDLFLSNPIKGNGWSTDIIDLHNVYLEVAVGGGIFALLAFALILVSLITPLFDSPVPNRLAFAGLSYAIFAALGPTLYDRVLWGALALTFALHRDPDEEPDPEEMRFRDTHRPAEPQHPPARAHPAR